MRLLNYLRLGTQYGKLLASLRLGVILLRALCVSLVNLIFQNGRAEKQGGDATHFRLRRYWRMGSKSQEPC